MEYNIDIVVAGCNTTCMHCYVNGGKAPSMQMEDFKYCMEKLEPVFAHFGEKVGFTLDNELYNHPKAKEILELVEQNYAKNYYHHGSTTGIAILEHPDREEIFEILKRNGWLEASFAIHGGRETHDKIVNCNGALDAIRNASYMFKENGFQVLQQLQPGEMRGKLAEKETAFFHINQKLDFYIGNTGSALKYCGNLKACSSEELIEWIESSTDNFYETATIHYEDILDAISNGKLVRSKENYVYPNEVSAIIAMIQNGRNS